MFAGMREGKWERRKGRVRSRKEFGFYFNYSETSVQEVMSSKVES